jgi:hypothetical protein
VRPGGRRTLLGGLALAGACLLAFPSAAVADGVTGSATVGGNGLTMITPAAVTFTGTLNGHPQTLSTNQALDITAEQGTGDPWAVALTTTQFTAGTATLALDAASDISATGVCDDQSDPDACVMAPDRANVIAIPAGASAPTAVQIQAAATDEGRGSMTFTHVMHLAVLPTARAGAYTSTWTYSLMNTP